MYSGPWTAAAVCVRSPHIGCAVRLMVELCPFTGLGKRKRVMDEKELMLPLELGYVQEAGRKKALIKRFTSKNVVTFMTTSTHGHKCTMHTVFILKNPGGGEKQESNQWRGGRRARWPTTARVAKN